MKKYLRFKTESQIRKMLKYSEKYSESIYGEDWINRVKCLFGKKVVLMEEFNDSTYDIFIPFRNCSEIWSTDFFSEKDSCLEVL